MPNWFASIIIVCFSILLVACNKTDSIVLGTTSTLQDSGLLNVLVDTFNQQHNVQVKPVVAGSGHIFSLIERGDVDIAITHEPIGEQYLLKRNILEKRIPLMYNYFLIVGPNHDPAHIRSATSADDAFKKIYNSNSPFVSRHDNSGTHRVEQSLWTAINQQPTAPIYIRTGIGMGATLTIAAEKNAYTLVDLGTWLNFQNKQSLTILFQEQSTSSQLKTNDLLTNQYSLLRIHSTKANQHYQKQADIFAQWIQRPSILALISNYRLKQHTIFITNL